MSQPLVKPLPESGLILEVPAAEPAVGRHRATLDANARLGVPAHITVLFPFMPLAELDETVLATLRELFAGVPAFAFRLSDTAWFGEDVLWLAPEDPQPFTELTKLVYDAFPDYAPYGGEHPDNVPHLTVAHDAEPGRMTDAERALEGHLPIACHAAEVTLVTRPGGSGQWLSTKRFALASRAIRPDPG